MTHEVKQRFSLACLAFLILAGTALAHEGHLHHVMGTVVAAAAARLDVKGTDGKALVLVVDGATKIVRGTTVIKATDLHSGERVVATYMPMKGSDGSEMFMAKDVKTAAPAPAPAK
jgi:hypothetical protein